MITHSVSLSFQNDISRNNVPLFLLNVNVKLPIDERFLQWMPVAFSHRINRRVRSRLADLVQHAGHNTSWPTSSVALERKRNPITSSTVFSIFFATEINLLSQQEVSRETAFHE